MGAPSPLRGTPKCLLVSTYCIPTGGSPSARGLLFLHSLPLFCRFGGDGRGGLRFRGVVLLHIGGGGGDSTPSFAGLITDRYRCQEKAKQTESR